MLIPELNTTDYDKSQFSKIWDSSTVIEYLVELMSSYSELAGETSNIGILVRRARLFSALKAFTGVSNEKAEKDIDMLVDTFFCNIISDSTLEEIKAAMVFEDEECLFMKQIKRQPIDKYFIRDFFRMMLMYRVNVYKAMKTYSTILETSYGGYLGKEKTMSIYDSALEVANQKIDSILALLLGDQFKKTFSEVELIEKYNYPTITNKDIFEWMCDNL